MKLIRTGRPSLGAAQPVEEVDLPAPIAWDEVPVDRGGELRGVVTELVLHEMHCLPLREQQNSSDA
jgi:hypothetical protein